jgi:hypothetical protein
VIPVGLQFQTGGLSKAAAARTTTMVHCSILVVFSLMMHGRAMIGNPEKRQFRG